MNEPEISEGASDIADRAIATAEAADLEPADIAHALIAAGLSHMRGRLCDKHLVKELAWVAGFVSMKMMQLNGERGN